MATNYVKKLDSNVTGLRYAEEVSIGVLPAATSQIWYPLEPNSYTDFGAQTKTVARQPINPSRQLRKGTLVDLDPAGGFANDFTQDGLTRLLQGFFVANLREDFDTQAYNAVNGESTITAVVAASHKYEIAEANATIVANDLIFTAGFTKNANNGLNVVSSSTSSAATGTLTSTGNPANNDTVTIGTRVYTFQTTLTDVDGNVHIGASATASLLNLANAINNTGGGVPGTDYFVTQADPNVSAASGASTLTATALQKGYEGNSVATTASSAAVSWGGADLSGGVFDIVTVATTLADETPTSAARLQRVGFQGASGDLTILNDGVDLPSLLSTVLDFTTLPLIPGQWIWIGGDAAATEFATAANNGWGRIRSIATHAIVFDKTSNEMVTDAGTGKTIQLFWGKLLQNEATPSIQVRRTYTMERSLGNPDMNNPTAPQAEYVVGAVPNELTINMTTADKITFDMTFLGTDYNSIPTTDTILSQVSGAQSPNIVFEDAYNTTSHVVRAKMSILSLVPGQAYSDAAPSTLFAEITEFKFMVKNNDKANKALGKLGPFEITFGFFEGSGSVQAYFNQVAAVQAVRDNADVSIDFAVANNNAGVLFDLPLLTLQTKGLDVKINEPIMLPIDFNMGSDRNFNTTMVMEFFPYLPTVAMPV